MSWHGYVPKEVWDKFKEDDPHIADDLRNYGMVRKHGGDTHNSELVALFHEIKKLKIDNEWLRGEIKNMENYTNSLEKKIWDSMKGLND